MVERKNLILLTFVLTGMVLVLLALNFRGSSGLERQAEILDTLTDKGPFPTKLSKSVVSSFVVNQTSGKVFFYEDIESLIYEINSDGRDKKEIARIPGAKKIVFSPDGQRLIADKYLFDLTENKKTALDPKIKAVAFSPDGSEMAYYLYDVVSGEGTIHVTGQDDREREIFRTRIQSAHLDWTDKDMIVFANLGIGPDGNNIRFLEQANPGPAGETMLDKLGIEALSSQMTPFGNYLVYLNAKDKKLYSLKIK